MTEEQIAAFLAIYETGSFNRAAEKLYITQPAVTNRIRQLESDLDVALLSRRRSTNGTCLSEAGMAFLPCAQAMQGEFIRARETMQRFQQAREYTLGFISAMMDGSSTAYFHIMHDLAERLAVSLQSVALTKPQQQKRQLLSGQADLLFTDLSAEAWNSPDIGKRKLFDGSACVYVHKHNPLAQQREITLQMLSSQPLYGYEDGTFLLEYVQRMMREQDLSPVAAPALCTSLLDALKNITAEQGILLVNIPRSISAEWVRIPVERRVSQPVGLVWLKENGSRQLMDIINAISDIPMTMWRK